MKILEREHEMASLEALIETVPKGSGAIAVVEGPAGIGKTRLLDAAATLGAEHGLRVLRTRGGEMEQGLAWGVVRDLFIAPVSTAGEGERDQLLEGAAALSLRVVGDAKPGRGVAEESDLAMVVHGVYWLAANLASRMPLLLVIDDAHWGDLSSLRWVAYLASRLDGIAVAVILGARATERGGHNEILDRICAEPACRTLQPRPLSKAASGALVRRLLEGRVADDFAAACHEVTAGNPFFLTHLAGQVRDDGVAPTAENAAEVRRTKPEAVARAVLIRLSRLSEDSQELAAAISVLGTDVRLDEAAALAGLDEGRARAAGDALAEVEILAPGTPLDFVHPLVRHAIREELAPLRREELHRRAAEILDRGPHEVAEVAVHLLEVEPRADEWVVDRLHAAGREAAARGAPDVAASYLRRALAESPPPAQRVNLLRDLGLVEVAMNGATGIAPLREALLLSPESHRRAEIALEIGRFLRSVFHATEATEAYQEGLRALADNADTGLRRQLEIELVGAAILHGSTVGLAAEQLRRIRAGVVTEEEADDPALLLTMASMLGASKSPASVGADLAARLLAGGHFPVGYPERTTGVTILIWADRLEEADAILREHANDARKRGSMIALAWTTTHSSRVAFRLGALREAEADAREALAILAEQRWDLALPYALGPLCDALIEAGRFDEAQAILESHGLAAEVGLEWPCNEFLHSRGCLRIAQGEVQAGLNDVLECGRRLDAWGAARNPGIAPWHATAALAFAVLGEREEAIGHGREAVALAREFETPRELGVGLRAEGLVLGGESGIARLRETVSVLEQTPARLEHARALVDLGAALRRRGKVGAAQPPLREGLEMAAGCGASVLADRARGELVAAGARPRRDELRGRDALTASELRVARMAADGATNREIAQALFVTLRTVETHLTHAYQKLEIGSRTELTAALHQDRPD